MERRQLLKQSAFAIAAFSFSRELFANTSNTSLGINPAALNSSNLLSGMIRLGSNENPHGPSTLAKQAILLHVYTLCLLVQQFANPYNKCMTIYSIFVGHAT